jgi:imidazolonepropionase-like amidohydrolase
MVERAGLAPVEALRMVTATPAEACGLANDVGALAPGRVADLLIVRGNPVASIRDIHDVVAVYQSGLLTAGTAARSM